ncbi:cold shock domain-containing protein [Candidatus Poribacteria bacterium]|nr:cold shock domain-containing protein [Candidatus Poribacteria bacterium]
MPLDFGTIQNYNERGFGFVSCTIWHSRYSTSEIFFHIKKIKRKYPDLAQQLDNGSYRGVSFWYETETTHRGEQVSELWLDVQEI